MIEMELRPFSPDHAAIVASWIRSDAELLRLAPRTPPPTTPQKILDWSGEGRRGFLLFEANADPPCGYAEINRSQKVPYELWLGHIVVAPHRRGAGLGTTFVQLLLDRAFNEFGGQTVSLIVFPDNVSAIRCYQKCGFALVGEEVHRFRRGQPRLRMLRFVVDRDGWLRGRKQSNAPITATPRPILPAS